MIVRHCLRPMPDSGAPAVTSAVISSPRNRLFLPCKLGRRIVVSGRSAQVPPGPAIVACEAGKKWILKSSTVDSSAKKYDECLLDEVQKRVRMASSRREFLRVLAAG